MLMTLFLDRIAEIVICNTVNLEIFARVYLRSFEKFKSSRNYKITVSFFDIAKSCTSREFLTSLICLLKLFAKIKFSRKFPVLLISAQCTMKLQINSSL